MFTLAKVGVELVIYQSVTISVSFLPVSDLPLSYQPVSDLPLSYQLVSQEPVSDGFS